MTHDLRLDRPEMNISIRMAKEGSTISGLMDTIATLIPKPFLTGKSQVWEIGHRT
jgi:hypothetical protein